MCKICSISDSEILSTVSMVSLGLYLDLPKVHTDLGCFLSKPMFIKRSHSFLKSLLKMIEEWLKLFRYYFIY